MEHNEVSAELKFFLDAFDTNQYGKSMGRAAETALADFGRMSPSDQQKATDYVYKIISVDPCRVYGVNYIRFVALFGDSRFLPWLKEYLSFLKKEKPTFKSEIENVIGAIDSLENR